MQSVSGRSSSCSRVSFKRWRTPRWRGRCGRADRETTTRWAIESNVFSQLPARPHDVVEQLHVLDGARELAAELVGAIEQIELAAGLDAHAVEDDRAERAAAAAQRHGHDAASAASPALGAISARARRIATAAGASGSSALTLRRRAATCSGSDEACSTR